MDFRQLEEPTPILNVSSHSLRSKVPSRLPGKSYQTMNQEPSILLISASKTILSDDAKLVVSVVQALRIPIHTLQSIAFVSQITRLTENKSFALIIFEDASNYFMLPVEVKAKLDEYCRKNDVGVVGFMKNAVFMKALPNDDDFAEVSHMIK